MAGANKLFELEPSHRGKHRFNVAVLAGAVLEDLKDIIGRDEIFTFENASDRIDLIHGQLGQVGERAFADFLTLAVRLSEQDGRFGVSIGDDVDMHAHINNILIINKQLLINITCLRYATQKHPMSAATPCT